MLRIQSVQLVFLIVLAPILPSAEQHVPAADKVVTFDNSVEGETTIKIGEQQVAVYVYQDDQISRPYFAHLRAPGAPQASRKHPPTEGQDRADHPLYHPGLWMSFGDISGNDYWRLKAAVKQDRWANPPRGGTAKGSFAVVNHYLGQEDPSHVVCAEVCRITVLARPIGFLLLWDSTFSSDHEFYFGDQEEMGIGFRVATPIRVEHGKEENIPDGNGTMIDSAGRKNGDEIWGNSARWCDYSGTLDDQHVGIMLCCHPSNFRPSWFHARDYGLLLANPFGRDAFGKGEKSKVVIKPGNTLRLRYGVLVYASTKETSPDLATAYHDYVSVAGQ